MLRRILFAATIICLLLPTLTVGQSIDSSKQREVFLQKWKSQKTTGWILLGTGLASITIGFAVAYAETINTILGEEPSATGPVLLLVGTAASLTSIPFFVSASKNKRRAIELSVVPQSIRIPAMTAGNQKYPALRVTIPLK